MFARQRINRHHTFAAVRCNQLRNRTNGKYSTAIHNSDTRTDALRFFHVVSGVDHRPPLGGKALHYIKDRRATLRIDSGGWFV
jgi:hypothetical protein